MGSLSIKDLFDLHRFKSQQDVFKLLLYFPIGLVLLIFRLAVCCLYFGFSMVMPKSSRLWRFLMKGICILFGVFVKPDLKHRNDNVKLLVCNHISVIDHIVIDSMLNCRQVDNCSHFSEWNMPSLLYFPGASFQTEMLSYAISELQKFVNSSDLSVMIFPEGAMTNGKFGLLKFSIWPFALSLPIQPVVVQVSSISLINISPSVLGTSIWCDLLWFLFVPYTVFSLRILPTIVKNETESPEEFSKRAQLCMASALNVTPTVYTLRDKDEYEKCLASSTATEETSSSSSHELKESNEVAVEINKMALQVKEILPDVPLAIIQQDIGITKSVHDTIVRIVEGVVNYVPDQDISTYDHRKNDLPSLNMSVNKFGKTSKDRMISYQERKATLITAARVRYMKKHNLV